MNLVAAFISGLLFGAGLVISGMSQPARITAFLDIFGAWDPTLAFVMVGALGVYAALYRRVTRRPAPLFSGAFERNSLQKIDARLLAGAAVFGIGWGLGGLCPGPSVVALGTGAREAFLFFASMAAGMALYRLISSGERASTSAPTGCG